jgi:predicted alpha/beta-fold hydrolase
MSPISRLAGEPLVAPTQYRPARWLGNRHLMTIYANLAVRAPRFAVRRERWELPDGDFLDVDRAETGRADAPLVIICHGLEGSSQAVYVRTLQARLAARAVDSAALNFRSCSGELNRLPRFYHSGETTDLASAVARLHRQSPGRALGVAGFSLGGNVVLKFLSEAGASTVVRAAAVISVPYDLSRCCDALDGPGLPARVYRERFLLRLRRKALAKATRFPGLIDSRRVRAARLLREFDDAVTAPLHGYSSAADYYARASSGPHLAAIARPALLVTALDDPFIPGDSVPVDRIRANRHLSFELHERGGHVAFLAGSPLSPHRWAEERAAAFLADALRPAPDPA